MFELGNILSYLIYGPMILWLIRRNYDQIYVFKEKQKINKWQLRFYSLILLTATFLWAVDRWFIIFQIVVTFILGLLFFFEGKEYGKIKAISESKHPEITTQVEETNDSGKKPNKKNNKLRNVRNTCVITGIVTFLSLANMIVALLGGIPITLW